MEKLLPNQSFPEEFNYSNQDLGLADKKGLIFEPELLTYGQAVLPPPQALENLPTLKQLTGKEELDPALAFVYQEIPAEGLLPEVATPGHLLWEAALCPDFKSRVALIEKAYSLAAGQEYKLEAGEIALLARQALHTLWGYRLAKDVFLAHESQDSHSYQVYSQSGDRLYVGKHRNQFLNFPLKKVSRNKNWIDPDSSTLSIWLTWQILGLLPAGLVTLVLAPWAIFNFGKLWWRLRNQSKTSPAFTFEFKLAIHLAGLGLKWSFACWFVSILLLRAFHK